MVVCTVQVTPSRSVAIVLILNLFEVQAAGSTAKAMGANVKMSQAMAETSKTMTNMNKLMNPQQVAKTMQEFDVANTKMGMTEEMMNDALDDMLTESGDEEEGDAIVNQVLDEIGIEISDKVRLESIVNFQVSYVIILARCTLLHRQPRGHLLRRQFQRRTRMRTMKLSGCWRN